jgi:hypothetical protein
MKTFRAIFLSTAFALIAIAARADGGAIKSFPEVKDLPVQTNMPDVMTMSDGAKITTLKQ